MTEHSAWLVKVSAAPKVTRDFSIVARGSAKASEAPRLREVRLNEVGLEIGVTTPEAFRNGSQYNPNSDMVPVATLPPEVFECYYRPQDFDFSKFGGWRRFHKYEKNLKSRLSEFGWNDRYEHKYATVYIREIA